MDVRSAAGLRPTASAEARAALTRSGLRATRPRLAVHRALGELGGHRSADEVYEWLVASGIGLSRTSAYNALEALSRANLILAAEVGPGRALYETATSWHHHAVCRVCGRISDVACVVGTKPCLEAGVDGWVVDEAQVTFRGVCPQCGGDVSYPASTSAMLEARGSTLRHRDR
jgi:Fur family ferric uptake transcriptional regulator